MMRNDGEAADQSWCVLPVFNNGETVKQVAAECRSILKHVVVVDDGSTDTDVKALLQDLDVVVLRHEKNRGKGRAVLTASRYVEEHGGSYMITIDADGQHYPGDIEKILPLLREDRIVIGSRDFEAENIPGSSRFGRKFANFWLFVETGLEIDDCQSGFRGYPVRYLNQLHFKGAHYDFEAEVLAKAAWAGLKLKTVPVKVHYPEEGERVSNFKPFVDNLRFSLIHTMLVGRRLLPLRHERLVRDGIKPDCKIFLSPSKFIKMLVQENATPLGLGTAAAVGTFLAIMPLIFIHTLVILYVAVRLNLNKVVAVNVQHLFMPPFFPAICIETGYFMRHGRWLTDISFATIFSQFGERLIEWFLGALIIAPLSAFVMGALTYVITARLRKRGIAVAER